MAQSNKLGTFGGVFTPSILTILGVIMFLRLPWIVGQAGLWVTIGIILVAHLVSVTSGLSVSSIATDKKVRAGGTYYIISRSLGLPIGGTLGIALFVGLSFSVSLYLIGFSESFLGTFAFETTRNNIRIVGTIVLLSVTTLTFISTSLAIKTQYFIMSAIALALASVLLGSGDLAPASPHLVPVEGMAPVIVLFAIFFPAVTGFEAGVSMSGDLKDPKKSLPMGTIAAILVGLVVYIGLAVFFAFRVDPDSLTNDPNILLELSFFSPIVVAGIWGATISSAIGSILGAPRILQATSSDGITPRTFARGYGRTNEPRNAVVLAFALAEAGILIGELNVIARIVSMFFITTYGFLNLTCSIESWASTDFRPSFKVPNWISVVGALTCVIIMIQLDIVATLAATIVLAGIFTYLKRQELRLESGDTWEGVWSSMARSALQRLNRARTHSRNWRPNIILFSGGTTVRPHLLDLGQWLVSKRGILSNFDLVEQERPDVLFPKMHQSVRTGDEDVRGVFSRRLECQDVYQSMETVAQVYGFSGLDPNAVMMGWARNSRDPRRFGLLIHRLTQLDYNLLLLAYDVGRGFGRKERIDVWWGGSNNNITLSLALLKCLLVTEEWHEASVRLLTVIADSARTNRVHRNMNQVLEDHRIEGTVKVINNAVEQRAIEIIIQAESLEADLVIFGMPGVDEDTAGDFVARTNIYLEGVGSVLLVHASSSFETLDIGAGPQGSAAIKPPAGVIGEAEDADPIDASDIIDARPARELLVGSVSRLKARVDRVLVSYQEFLRLNREMDAEVIASFRNLIDRNFETLKKHLAATDVPRSRRLLARVRSDFLFHSQSLLERYQDECLPAKHANLDQSLDQLLTETESVLSETPEEVIVSYEESDLESEATDAFPLKARKFFERIRHRVLRSSIAVRGRMRALARRHLETTLREELYAQLKRYGVEQYQFASDLQKCLHAVEDSFGVIENSLIDGPDRVLIDGELQKTRTEVEDLDRSIERQSGQIASNLGSVSRRMIRALYKDLTRLDGNRRTRRRRREVRKAQELEDRILEVPAIWVKNQSLVLNFGLIDSSVMAFENRLNTIAQKLRTQLHLDIENNVLAPLTDLEATLERFQAGQESVRPAVDFGANPGSPLDSRLLLDALVEDVRTAIDEIPETIEIISDASFQTIEQNPYEELQTLRVSFRRLIDYLTETELIDPLREEMATIPVRSRKALIAARDLSRLLSLDLGDSGSETELGIRDDRAYRTETLKTAVNRLEEERAEMDAVSRGIDDLIRGRLEALSEKLNPYVVSRLAANLGHYIRTEESRKMLFGVVASGQRLKMRAATMMVRLLYRRSEGVLAARKLRDAETAGRSQVDSVLTLVEVLSPRPEVLRTLPTYYRQLFLGKQPIGTEFLVARGLEIEEAERTVRRYREGYRGALLVLAEPSAGKETLCRTIASRLLSRQEVVHLSPPPGGSIDPMVFRHRLCEALGSGSDGPGLPSLPPGSVVIVNELELWWERSPGGMAVIDQLIELIDANSEGCFFMVNAVADTFRFINRVRPIEDAFLGIVECRPFDAEELQEAILLRHRPSGFKFELDGQVEDALSDFKLAMLFNRHFDFSAGSVGVALEDWVSHIDQVKKDRLIIRSPRRPDLSPLDQLETHWLVWLRQFVLHRSLTLDRLVRLFRSSEPEVERDLTGFRRSGMITERSSGVFEINPYLEPSVIRKLAGMVRP